jgi:hypothetical protein
VHAQDRYSLAGGYYAIRGAGPSKPLRFQATDLGRFLYTREAKYLSGAAHRSVTKLDSASEDGNWRVYANGDWTAVVLITVFAWCDRGDRA